MDMVKMGDSPSCSMGDKFPFYEVQRAYSNSSDEPVEPTLWLSLPQGRYYNRDDAYERAVDILNRFPESLVRVLIVQPEAVRIEAGHPTQKRRGQEQES